MRDESRQGIVNAMRDPGTRHSLGFFVERERAEIRDLDKKYLDGDIDSTAYIAGLRKLCAAEVAKAAPSPPQAQQP